MHFGGALPVTETDLTQRTVRAFRGCMLVTETDLTQRTVRAFRGCIARHWNRFDSENSACISGVHCSSLEQI